MRTCASDSGDGLERLLERFFAAENARDWAAYASLLHPGVEWTLVDDGAERRIVGREDFWPPSPPPTTAPAPPSPAST